MFFRRPLMLLLSLGVVFGYGGAFASLHHRHHPCGARWDPDARFEERVTPQAAPAAVAPQTIVVQPAAPAPVAAPAPQIFVIMPGAAAPQAVQAVPAAVTAAPAPAAQ